ncbi:MULTISPECIES: anti-phage protein Ppl [Enterobacter]|uniref:anti-phage protein Ppl n=1 Tax=Enterobacter TaxID=547 RepID=UPI0013CF5867|nr:MULTISPECIES: anti-phage protein Ppl [Enterobacter]NMD64932.1 hypothetical protein [Enterobacter sp. DNRA5]HCU2525428.1 hypothetical protein [Enterobacter hormaechei]HDX4009637.1 hypothetical protein [Enterobacter asburiae]
MVVGSRWYKFDFHNHTPASEDYADKTLSDREWLLSYMRRQVDAVIISDHNTGAKIDSLKAELQRMTVDAGEGGLEGFRPLTLFPGVELTATGNVHILAVLNPECTGGDIERLIGQCNGSAPIPRQIPNHQLALQNGPAGIVGIIRQNPDALCILAHIDAPKGVLTSQRNLAELEATFAAGPHAVEIRSDPAEIQNGTHKRLIKDLPWIRGSDAHEPGSAGLRTCWLKMSEPNFDGLRNALLDHENCVLFDKQPPAEPAQHIRSLRIRTRLCKAENGAPASVNLSPFYNAVIGSRGSGKSTLVESIRLVMRKVDGLSQNHSELLQLFKQNGRGMDDNSEIECVYRKDGTDFKLSWRPGDIHTLQTWQNGHWEDDHHWSPDRFAISVFSQKMLFELASDNDAFLQVCDSSPIVDKRTWTEHWEQLIRDFKNERITYRGLLSRQNTASALTGELGDIRRSIAQLSESDYFPIRNRLASAEKELTESNDCLNTYRQLLDSLSDLLPESASSDDEEKTEVSAAYISLMAKIQTVQTSLYASISGIVTEHLSHLEQLKADVDYLTLAESVGTEKENVLKEADQLRAQGLNPDMLNDLVERKEKVSASLREYADLDGLVSASATRIDDLMRQLQAHRKELTARRREFIATLNLNDLDVKILPLSAPPEAVITDYQSTTGINNFTDRIYDTEQRSGLLAELINHYPIDPRPAVTEQKYALLQTLKNLHRDIKEGVEGTGQDIHGAFSRRLGQLTDDNIDNLMCWFPDDGINIRYRAHSGNMEDISLASPGQKGASMLQFLLSYGTDPLILDQPEDDLDCMMLSKSVIPAIVSNKQRRQLIIVSHSAPIVVNGDAEYVISMAHDRHGLRPALCGALQETKMKQLICSQMEGGEKAFRSRFNRILNIS